MSYTPADAASYMLATQTGPETVVAFAKITFDTVITSRGSKIAHASGQFTLEPGKYFVEASVYLTSSAKRTFHLYNVTDGAAVAGSLAFMYGAFSSGDNGGGSSNLACIVDIDATKVFELREAEGNGWVTSTGAGRDPRISITEITGR